MSSAPKFRAIVWLPDCDDGDGYVRDVAEMIEGDSLDELISGAVHQARGEPGPASMWILDPSLTERLTLAVAEKIEQDRIAAERQKLEFEEERKRDAEIRRADNVTALRLLIEGLEDGTELAKAKAKLEALEAPSLAPGGEA